MSDRPIAIRALENARLNLGIREEGNNAGKAVESYLASCVPPLPLGNPWCVAVVRFRLKQAATQRTDIRRNNASDCLHSRLCSMGAKERLLG